MPITYASSKRHTFHLPSYTIVGFGNWWLFYQFYMLIFNNGKFVQWLYGATCCMFTCIQKKRYPFAETASVLNSLSSSSSSSSVADDTFFFTSLATGRAISGGTNATDGEPVPSLNIGRPVARTRLDFGGRCSTRDNNRGECSRGE